MNVDLLQPAKILLH